MARGRTAVIVVALACGFVLAALDSTVVNVTGPSIRSDLGASLAALTWVVDGYVVAFAALLLPSGSIADRFGAKRVYLVGTAVFVAASLGCALASSVGELIALRVVQGAGAALLLPASMGLLVHAFPDRGRRTTVLAVWSAIVAAASALGPCLGGVLVDAFGWRSVFLINLPVSAIGIALSIGFVPAVDRRAGAGVSRSHLLLAAGLAALSIALVEGPDRGWTSVPVLTAGIAAVAVVALFAVVERRSRTPAIPWALFADRRFTGANLVGFGFNFGLFGSLFMLGLYLQQQRGASPLQAGLELLPITVLSPAANLAFGRIHRRFSTGALMTCCLAVAATATAALVGIDADTGYVWIAVALMVANAGIGVVSPAMTATLVDAASPANANHAGAVLNATRQVGLLVGVAVMSVLLSSRASLVDGARLCFVAVASAYALAAVASWWFVARRQRARVVPAPLADDLEGVCMTARIRSVMHSRPGTSAGRYGGPDVR